MSESFLNWIKQLPPDARPPLARALRRHAVRQLATLKASGAALAHAPTLDDRIGALERAKEELAHLEQAAELYRELSGADLLQDAESVAAALPVPESWVEASVAQLVLCLAARVDLDEHRDVTRPFGLLAQRALAEETEHVSAARAALVESCARAGGPPDAANAYMQRWLSVALGSLDEETTRTAYMTQLEREASVLGLTIKK